MKCRIDNKKCKTFLDLGKMPIANGFLKKKDISKEYYFNLSISFNNRLSLMQINENPDPKKMFNKDYPFYTSSSKLMSEHFNKTAKWIKRKYLDRDSYLLELGSNDGTFLKHFNKKKSFGFEPSKSVHKISKKRGLNSINNFFNYKNTKKFLKKKIYFDVIFGANVFCHIPNQNDLIRTIDKVLSKKGVLIFEEPYLGSMYKKTSYDQIYDEHIYMFSLHSIKKVYEKFGFELIDAIPQKTHGGSMRYILKRINTSVKTNRLKKLLSKEKKDNVDNFKGCMNFKKKVEKSKKKLLNKINSLLKRKEKICGYGATSKSTTILNYCGINFKHIECIFDTTPDKINKLTPGTHIPVKDYKLFKNSNYKNIFLFAWNHKKEIMLKEKNKKNLNWFNHL